MILRFLVVLLGAIVASHAAFAACTNTVTVKDGAGVSQTFCRGTDGTNMISSVNILDSAGTNFAAVTAANALKVDSSAVTQPVSGTVTANQGGTWNVGQSGNWTNRIVGNAGAILDFAGQNAAAPANSLLTGCEFNTSPTTIVSGNASPIQCTSAARLIVDGSQVTQPVSGTVTANAGTNLNTSALALESGGNLATVAGLSLGQASTTSGQKGVLVQGAVTTAKPSYTTAQTDPLSLDTSGLLRVSLADTPANTNSFLVTATQSGNWTTRIVGNAGAVFDFAGQNIAQPANSLLTGCAFNTSPTTVTSGNATQIQCDNVGDTLVKVNVALPTGANTIGKVDILGNAGATLDAAVGAAAAPTNGQAVLGVFNTTAPAPTNGQSAALQLSATSNLLVEQGCAGQSVANTSYKVINLASTTAINLVPKVAAKKTYICSLNLVSGTAQNVALIEGTLTTNPCDTSTAGLAGGTTAATGWNLAANGGLTIGNGQGFVFKSGTANLDTCLISSSTGQISGSITFVQF